ncbi:hypothetical protein Tsubulata_038882, partial [Turnera subulata]
SKLRDTLFCKFLYTKKKFSISFICNFHNRFNLIPHFLGFHYPQINPRKKKMAGESAVFKFLSPRRRPQPTDVQAAAFWGVAAGSAAIYLIQPFDWIKKTFFEKPEEGK